MLCTLVTCMLSLLSLEHKVGQMLIPHFQGRECTEEAKMLINDLHVGGFIYYEWANGLDSQKQVAQLSASLQREAAIPLLLAIDEEGGGVSRLRKIFTPAPAPSTYKTPEEAYAYAQQTSENLLSVGINFNLAPVADIAFSDRSYGKDPKTVITHASAALEGYRKNAILTCLKHFPGHGATETDSHFSLPVVDKSLSELAKWELQPFWHLKADAIMTAHLLLPKIDPINCATLSPTIINLLRKNFDGVIITDSLAMRGLLDNADSKEEAAIRAIQAGADMLILGGSQLVGNDVRFMFTPEDICSIHRAIVNAVKTKKISEEQITASTRRILRMKTSTENNCDAIRKI